MGAWGYGPFESDQALDWVGEEITGPVLETLQKTVMKDLDETTMHEIQAAVFVFLSLVGHPSRVLDISRTTVESFVQVAVAALEGVNVSVFVRDWDDPDAARAENVRLIEALKALDPEEGVVGTTLMGKILGVIEEPPLPEVDAVWFDTRNGLRARIVADDPEHDEIVAEALDEVGGRATMSRSAFLDFWKPVGPRPEAEEV